MKVQHRKIHQTNKIRNFTFRQTSMLFMWKIMERAHTFLHLLNDRFSVSDIAMASFKISKFRNHHIQIASEQLTLFMHDQNTIEMIFWKYSDEFMLQ